MPLTLKSPLTDPERILVMGVQGTGKSKGILDIARAIPTSDFRILDIDYSPGMRRLQHLQYPELTNIKIEVIDPEDFDAQVEGLQWLVEETGPDDWCSIDSMSHTWSAVQSWFIEKVHGVDPEEYFMQVRMKKEEDKGKKKALGALEGWMDWPVINKQYFRKVYRNITRIAGHVYMTAEQTSIVEAKDGMQGDGKDIRGLYGAYGVKPAAQKRLGFVPNSIILLTKSRQEDYAMTTVKDRGRQEMEDWEIHDFAKDYLIKVAGWQRKPVKV